MADTKISNGSTASDLSFLMRISIERATAIVNELEENERNQTRVEIGVERGIRIFTGEEVVKRRLEMEQG